MLNIAAKKEGKNILNYRKNRKLKLENLKTIRKTGMQTSGGRNARNHKYSMRECSHTVRKLFGIVYAKVVTPE